MLTNLGDQWTYFLGLFLFHSDPFTDVQSCIHRSEFYQCSLLLQLTVAAQFPRLADVFSQRWMVGKTQRVAKIRSFTPEGFSQSVERALTPSLVEKETYSSISLFIMYMSMLQPVMSHEPYNSLLSLLSAHSMDIPVWSSYRRTRMSTNRYVTPCTNTLF